jgi:hypothetical protein
VILYEWRGEDGHHYRMAAGNHAQHKMHTNQSWELQISKDRIYWIPMVDWNSGLRAPDSEGEAKP